MYDWLERAANRHPERLALTTPERELSYRQLADLAVARAYELRAAGARPGERRALEVADRFEFAVELHACLRVGAAAVGLREITDCVGVGVGHHALVSIQQPTRNHCRWWCHNRIRA